MLINSWFFKRHYIELNLKTINFVIMFFNDDNTINFTISYTRQILSASFAFNLLACRATPFLCTITRYYIDFLYGSTPLNFLPKILNYWHNNQNNRYVFSQAYKKKQYIILTLICENSRNPFMRISLILQQLLLVKMKFRFQ